jgi:hypothetical protein
VNNGTLNLSTGARLIGDLTGTGAVSVINNFTSEGGFIVNSFGILNTGIFNMDHAVTVASGFSNAGHLVIASNKTIAGNYNQSPTGVIEITLDGRTFSKLTITQTATFSDYSATSIIIKPGSEPTSGHTYSGILSAQSILGVDSALASKVFIENPSETYIYTIVQNGNDLDLVMDAWHSPVVNSSDPPRANQANTLIQLAMITSQAVRDRLNWMSGSSYQGATGDNRLWMTPYTSWGVQDDSAGAYKQKISGLIIGGDKSLTEHFYVGASAAIGQSDLTGTEIIPHENFSAKNYQTILYAKYAFADTWHLKSYAMAGVNKSELSRFDVADGRDAHASLTGYYAGVSVALEKEFRVTEKQKIIPTIGLNYVSSSVNNYKDTINSTYDTQKAHSLVYSIGGMYQYSFNPNNRLQLKYERGYDPLAKQGVLNSTNDDMQQFQLLGIVPGRQIKNAGINYHLAVKDNTFLDFDYHLMASANYKAEMLSASLHYLF